VLDINDLGLARERGANVVGIAALVQQPLGALIVQPYIKRPRDLQGRKVGVSGLPSDPAFLRAILSRAGASLRRVDQITIGFNAVAQMLAGTIAGVPAFWSDEGVTLRQRGLPVREFRINHYGAPNFPEVVLAVTRATLRRRRAAIIRALAAIAVGAHKAVTDPQQATRVIATAAAGDPRLIRAQTLAIAPALQPPAAPQPKSPRGLGSVRHGDRPATPASGRRPFVRLLTRGSGPATRRPSHRRGNPPRQLSRAERTGRARPVWRGR